MLTGNAGPKILVCCRTASPEERNHPGGGLPAAFPEERKLNIGVFGRDTIWSFKMRNRLLASCAIAAIALTGGLARAQAPQGQSAGQTSQTTSPAQTTEHSRGAEGAQRGAETAAPGRSAAEEKTNTNMGHRDKTERRADERSEQRDRPNEARRGEGGAEQRSERHEHFNDERGRREEGREQRSERQERFNDERGRRGEGREQRSERRERFDDERGRGGEEGFREERRYRAEREFDRDRDRRYQDRRYGDQSNERSFQDRRYGARAERYEGQGQLHISRRQRARVHDILVRRRVEPESIDFPVRIGARVPSYITSYRIPDERL